MRERESPRIVGAAEYVDFPDWGVRGLSARVDTGARTSALHVENVDRPDRSLAKANPFRDGNSFDKGETAVAADHSDPSRAQAGPSQAVAP